MVTAYFDESGTGRDHSKWLTIGGYISTVQKWEDFDLDWQALLDEFNIEFSHAVDMAQFKCQFSDWDATYRRTFEEKAHEIIKKHTLQPFDISLLWEDYDVLIPTYRGKNAPSAYGVLVNRLLFVVADWVRENNITEPINYVFERNLAEEGSICRNYAAKATDEAKLNAWQMRTLTFAEGKIGVDKVIQLQAADINAYEVCKHRNDGLSGMLEIRGKPRGSLSNLRPDNTTYCFNREGLAIFLKEIEANDELR